MTLPPTLDDLTTSSFSSSRTRIAHSLAPFPGTRVYTPTHSIAHTTLIALDVTSLTQQLLPSPPLPRRPPCCHHYPPVDVTPLPPRRLITAALKTSGTFHTSHQPPNQPNPVPAVPRGDHHLYTHLYNHRTQLLTTTALQPPSSSSHHITLLPKVLDTSVRARYERALGSTSTPPPSSTFPQATRTTSPQRTPARITHNHRQSEYPARDHPSPTLPRTSSEVSRPGCTSHPTLAKQRPR